MGKRIIQMNSLIKNFLGCHIKNIIFITFALFIMSIFFVHSTDKFERTTDAIANKEILQLNSGQSLEQKITCSKGNVLSSVNVIFKIDQKANKGNINLNLYKNGKTVQSWSVLLEKLKDNQYQTFQLDNPIELDKNTEYILRIESEYPGENGVALYKNSDIDSQYTIDGDSKLNGSICYTLTYQFPQLKKWFLAIGFLIIFMVAIATLLKLNGTAIMVAIIGMLLACFMRICPLGMAPDEGGHFCRAYEIANVSLISRHTGEKGEGGNILPKAIIEYKNKKVEIDWNDTAEIPFGNTALYSPISYLPQVLGIKTTQLFTDNVSKIFYGGKCGNALASFIFCVLALWMIPFGKKIIFIIMTFPLTIQEMVSMAPDGFTISIALFFLAYILRLAYTSKKVKRRDIVILCAAGLIISLLKIVYVVLLLLILLIPREKFNSKKQNAFFKYGLIGSAIILNLIWLKISFGYLVEFMPGVNSSEQVKYVLSHMTRYYAIAIRTLINKSHWWVANMISSEMGALDIVTTSMIWICVIVVFVYEVCSCYPQNIRVRKYDSLIMASTFLSGVVLIFTSLYVQWTPLKNSIIDGIQGRYFTVILGAMAMAVVIYRQNKIKIYDSNADNNENGKYIQLTMFLLNSIVLLDMANYYIKNLRWG